MRHALLLAAMIAPLAALAIAQNEATSAEDDLARPSTQEEAAPAPGEQPAGHPLMHLAEEDSLPPRPIDIPGVARAWAFNDLMLAGDGPPASEAAFQALAQAGVRTIVSVDFAPPDAFAAASAGIDTVHTPVAHGRWRHGDITTMLRVVTFLEGPYYFHAAAGEDRALPLGALAAAWNERLGPGRVAQLLHDAGFPREGNEGIWADIESPRFAWIERARIQPVPSQFPERMPPPPLAVWMRRFAEHEDWLAAAREQGWTWPAEGGWPASVPAFEAESLAAAMASWRATDGAHSSDIHALMERAEARARELGGALRAGEQPAIEDAWQALRGACLECHVQHRDAAP